MSGKDNVTNNEMDIILEVNRKAVEIHTEVGRQNEDILEDLGNKEKSIEALDGKLDKIFEVVSETNRAISESIKDKVDDIEKNLFRLIAILSAIGVGTIITIVHEFVSK
jgi:hypothetical protein